MYGSKVMDNLEDDCYCEEMNIYQQELYPQIYYSRKKNGKGKSYENYQKSIEEYNSNICPREERLHCIKPFKRKNFNRSLTSKYIS
ncbi:hypothetical protein M0802_014799 [Mischocyttarus mexicanus]|nr:hypothetical protein M0802_014799 [Mischocyttarus mexicanus]